MICLSSCVPISTGKSAESERVGRNDSWYIHRDIQIIGGTSKELLSDTIISIFTIWPFESRLPYRSLTHLPCVLLSLCTPLPSRLSSFRHFFFLYISLPLPHLTSFSSHPTFSSSGSLLILSRTQRLCFVSPQTPASSPPPWSWTANATIGTTLLSSLRKEVRGRSHLTLRYPQSLSIGLLLLFGAKTLQ